MTQGSQDRPSGSLFFSERKPPAPLFPALAMAAILRSILATGIDPLITSAAHFTDSLCDFRDQLPP
jgi:hypothetical protein